MKFWLILAFNIAFTASSHANEAVDTLFDCLEGSPYESEAFQACLTPFTRSCNLVGKDISDLRHQTACFSVLEREIKARAVPLIAAGQSEGVAYRGQVLSAALRRDFAIAEIECKFQDEIFDSSQDKELFRRSAQSRCRAIYFATIYWMTIVHEKLR